MAKFYIKCAKHFAIRKIVSYEAPRSKMIFIRQTALYFCYSCPLLVYQLYENQETILSSRTLPGCPITAHHLCVFLL